MLLRINCVCGHSGVASDALLPRDLQCSRCGSRREVTAECCRAIYSHARFQEWIEGTRERPQARKAVSL